MVDLLHRRSPERAFPIEIEAMVERVAAQRREFLANSPLTPSVVRPTIRESWQRCTNLVEPEREVVPLVIASDREMQVLYEKNDAFLKASDAVVRRLTGFLAGSGFTLALADAKGLLLRVSGDKESLSGLERIGLAPGCDWSEANAGTNGIGTALALGRAVRVIGPEHFCDGWQNITCITTPIRNPWIGEIIGLLDLSGDYHLVQPFFTGILAAAALEIRENLRVLLAPGSAPLAPFQVMLPERQVGMSPAKKLLPGATRTRSPQRPTAPAAPAEFPAERVVTAERLAIAAGMISANLDFDTTLSQVAEQTAHLLDADLVAVCLLDDAGEIDLLRVRCNTAAHAGPLYTAVSALVKQSEMVWGLHESGEPVVIDDVLAIPQLQFRAIVQSGMRTLALLPLQGAQRVSGFILAARSILSAWRPDDLRLGLSIAYHTTTALENARLYQTLQQHHRRLEALNAVNQVLTSMFDPAQQLGLIIQRIVEILKLDWGAIWPNQKRTDLGTNLGPGLDAPHTWPETATLNLDELGEQIAPHGKPSLFCRLHQTANPAIQMLQAAGLCDLLFAPLAAGSDLFGFLVVASRQHCEFDEEDLALVTNIGQQLGLALKNAQLQRAAGEAHVLRQANQIKSDFLLMVSHDLRSPLTAIRASVDGLLDPGKGHTAESQTQLLKNIGGQAKRLDKLVGKLLDLLRIEAGELRIDRDWTELGALVTDTVAKFERLNTPCQISLQIAEDLPLVYVDPEYMVQVLWNLLENARKYSPSTSRISVSALAINGEVFLRVADRGPGIPAEEREKIFHNYYRLPREQQMRAPGSGLGLAICRGVVESHGGRIWVEERPGGGSVFCVVLPPFLPIPVV